MNSRTLLVLLRSTSKIPRVHFRKKVTLFYRLINSYFASRRRKVGEIKLTSTADGIRKIIEGSEKLKDGLLDNLNEDALSTTSKIATTNMY